MGMSRRELLKSSACGFGSLAAMGMLGKAFGGTRPGGADGIPHVAARAKRVIFLFMQGGPSHVDSFDFKPKLVSDDGKEWGVQGYRFDSFRQKTSRTMMKPLWDFEQYGQSGKAVSSLFPNVARHVDDLCFLHGMHTEGIAHGPATLFLHTGSVNLVRPSVGSWVSYGLGTENQDMPGFVTISPTARMGGPQNYGNAFLPAAHQGTAIGRAEQSIEEAGIKHISNQKYTQTQQRRQFDLLQALNRTQVNSGGFDDRMEAALDSFELAFRMQTSAPGILDLQGESKSTKDLYGIDDPVTDNYGRQCLMARRLAESGVRYIQVNYSDNDGGNPRWDQHSNMPKHKRHAQAVDKPIAGLLTDLKARIAGGHLGLVGRRVWPNPIFSEQRWSRS